VFCREVDTGLLLLPAAAVIWAMVVQAGPYCGGV